MRNFKKFEAYRPEDGAYGLNVLYFMSECGIDWYDAQDLFCSDTLKIAYDEDGCILNHSLDASRVIPINCSIVEVGRIEDFNSNEWQVLNGKLIPKSPSEFHSFNWNLMAWELSSENEAKLMQKIESAERRKFISEVDKRISEAEKKLSLHQYKIDLRMESDIDLDEIWRIKLYIIKLSNLEYPCEIPYLD